MLQRKKIWIISSVILLLTVIAIFVIFKLFNPINYISKYCFSPHVVEDSLALSLKEREIKIKNMKQALLICYDISEYEAHYYSIIYDDFSKKYGIPWEIYPATIRIESNFGVASKSNKGAKGIAQVMDSTAAPIAKKLGIDYDDNTLWNDILCQIIGFTYLSEAIKKTNIEDGLRTYFGGPGFDKGRKDIGQYRTTVEREYKVLQYVYKGVMAEK
jgi:hypothetical protein